MVNVRLYVNRLKMACVPPEFLVVISPNPAAHGNSHSNVLSHNAFAPHDHVTVSNDAHADAVHNVPSCDDISLPHVTMSSLISRTPAYLHWGEWLRGHVPCLDSPFVHSHQS